MNASVARLKAALRGGGAPAVLATPIDVSTNADRDARPSLGESALIYPAPAGFAVRPNPQTLGTIPEVYGHASELWRLFAGDYAATGPGSGSWYQAVIFSHVHAGANSGSPCALHFSFDGRAFEVLYAGSNPGATVLVDGQFATPLAIRRTWSGGIEGSALGVDTFVRFDLGSAAPRRIALYTASTLGPRAIAVGAGDSIRAWNRSGEASMAVMSDSYGASLSPRWISSGIFFEAAQRLGIPHVDIDAVGGTGYAPNNVVTSPALSFEGRLGQMTRRGVDLFLLAGGINDNSWLPLAPYATADEARVGFEAAVRRTFTAVRTALPEAVVVALAPWQPDATYYPAVAASKADAIRAGLAQISGPWVFVDNLRGGWLASSGASGTSPGQGWQTGTGTVAAPAGDGNGDLYISADGTHPSPAGAAWLGEQLADSLRAAISTL